MHDMLPGTIFGSAVRERAPVPDSVICIPAHLHADRDGKLGHVAHARDERVEDGVFADRGDLLWICRSHFDHNPSGTGTCGAGSGHGGRAARDK
jgi:hypothetical protein